MRAQRQRTNDPHPVDQILHSPTVIPFAEAGEIDNTPKPGDFLPKHGRYLLDKKNALTSAEVFIKHVYVKDGALILRSVHETFHCFMDNRYVVLSVRDLKTAMSHFLRDFCAADFDTGRRFWDGTALGQKTGDHRRQPG